MLFPVNYKDLFLPKLIIHHTLTLISLITNLLSTSLRSLRLLEPVGPTVSSSSSAQITEFTNEFTHVSAILMRELLPVVKFSELVDPPESCAVCLYEFDGDDDIRRLANCRHVFHRSCVDRWMEHDQNTCPMCRAPFVPYEMQDAFNEKLWAASGVGDYCEEDYWSTAF